jgi:hypothetical protein
MIMTNFVPIVLSFLEFLKLSYVNKVEFKIRVFMSSEAET